MSSFYRLPALCCYRSHEHRRVGPGLRITQSFEVCFLITWSGDDTGGGAGGRSEHRESLELRVPQTHSQHHPGASFPDGRAPNSGQGLRPGESPVASEIPWLLKYQVQHLSYRKLKFRDSARCWAHQQGRASRPSLPHPRQGVTEPGPRLSAMPRECSPGPPTKPPPSGDGLALVLLPSWDCAARRH